MNTINRLLAALKAIQKLCQLHRDGHDTDTWPVPAIHCVDGFRVSVQGNKYAYCTPRDDKGPYETFELGFPSERPSDEVMEYCEDPSKPTDTVYGRVPWDTVERLIDAHGGLAPLFAALASYEGASYD